MQLWLVGKPLVVDGVEIGWMAEGAFQTEQAAAEASQSGEFIVQVAVDARFPEQAVDAEKLYFPRAETWEQSALYRMRND